MQPPMLASREGQAPSTNWIYISSGLQQPDLILDHETGNKLPDFLPGSVVYAFSASCLQKE